MADDGDSVFVVGRLPLVDNEIGKLSNIASVLGKRDEFFRELKWIVQALMNQPTVWGDPLHATRAKGGCVYRGSRSPFLVSYVVYLDRKNVMILSILPFPHSFLDFTSK